jgi:hypothetical protein
MLNIHIPLRLLRSTARRCSRFYKPRTNRPQDASSELTDSSSPEKHSNTENDGQSRASEPVLHWIFIFFRGVARAAAIGLFVAFVLALVPWFEPNIEPFQTRFVDSIQQYGIPICSGLLILYGVRAAL